MSSSLQTARLDLRPLPPAAAAVLPGDRAAAEAMIGAMLPADWPQGDLLDALPLQARSEGRAAEFGIWVLIERATRSVVGDAGSKVFLQTGLSRSGTA